MTVALGLVAGCGTAAVAESPPSAAPSPAATAAPDVPAGAVAVTGAVKTPRTVTADQLAALPQRTVSVQFGSGKGPEQHTETGALLTDLLPVDSLATTPAKNDQLSFAVVATGADGYRALVSYGEAAPDFGNRGLLVATSEDGKPLARPRLVVPGDVKGGRYVSDLVRLEVVRP
jgi:hypothetical protein